MKKLRFLISLLLITSSYLLVTSHVYAVEDPLAKPNNFVGIHILFPSELDQAKDLINTGGGDWGYVTIPLQITDLDLEKWQSFMDKAKTLHIIPIIRLATQNDPHNTSVWRKPSDADILDFANFLSSLSWPTKNKYIVLFNEVNRFDEWGGEYPNPSEYADDVSYASDLFKERDSNFYLILAGMDAASPNDYKKYVSGMTYLQELVWGTNIVSKIDGFASHSYPNPAFSAPPFENKRISIATYRFEYDLINATSGKKIPVFITETGWSDKTLPQAVIAKYYQTAFQDIWGKDSDKIVAITPFLLNAGGSPFGQFSFFKEGQPTEFLKTVQLLSKVKGDPSRNKGETKIALKHSPKLYAENFKPSIEPDSKPLSPFVSLYFKTLFGLN